MPFSLFHFEGYLYEEVAKILDLPIGTVKSRIFRARKMMKDMIESKTETKH
jgi:RNA polymerase sigma-70 factor (ECF subfamily)